MTTRGKLAVSVIEATHVVADVGSPPVFYVRISIGNEEYQTGNSSGLTPKFMKDLEFIIDDIQTSEATVEMLHVAPKGDLVLGTCRVNLKNPSGYEGRPSWLELRDPAGRPVAKLCVVMRFAAVGTPGRSIATPRTPMSPRGSTKTGASVAATSKTRGSKKQRAPVEPVESPKGNPLAGILGAVAGGVQRGLSLLLGVGGGRKKRSRNSADSKAASPMGDKAANGSAKTRGSGATGGGGGGVPVPVAVALGVAAGVLGWLWASRPVYYEVQEGDTLCDIAGCYNINYLDVFERNTDKLRDPDVIYPGDTLRIR